MKIRKNFLATLFALFTLVFFWDTTVSAAGFEKTDPVAEVTIGSSEISWQPRVAYSSLVLTVSRPDGTVFRKTFEPGSTPYFDMWENRDSSSIDGSYTYELRVVPVMEKRIRGEENNSFEKRPLDMKPLIQSGYFTVRGGSIATPSGGEDGSNTPLDQVIADDLIVDGSLCVGVDCVNGYNFGFDTIVLRENNLRIFFDDTSASASFPRNDWRIIVNDSANGGASYFGVEDATAGRRVFTLEAGAPAHSLYVDDGGRVGIGTSTPVVDVHTVSGNTPTLRLEQDGSSGFTPQTWDVAGNEANFFIRDATNGSALPFRIKPGAPQNSIFVDSDGDVGLGTQSPDGALDIEGSGSSIKLIVNRTDGAAAEILAKAGAASFGSKSNHPVQFTTNSTTAMTLNTDGSLVMNSGAECTAAGVWTDASSITLKENVQGLTTTEAVDALKGLTPVKFNYKADKNERYVGFIAEDVPDLVAMNSRKSLSPMDIVAVLTRVVQQQQEVISELKERVAVFEKKL